MGKIVKKTDNQKGPKRDRHQIKRQRAETFFWIYYQMGPERSIEKLAEMCKKVGLKKYITTLKNYSVDFGWQRRVLEVDASFQVEREQEVQQSIREMHERQTEIGRNLQEVAQAGLFTLQQVIEKGKGLKLTPAEIVSLARAGIELELRAAGEPMLKVEITTVLYNVLIARIAHIFKEVNKLPTAEAREARFATLVDQTADNALQEVNTLSEQNNKG